MGGATASGTGHAIRKATASDRAGVVSALTRAFAGDPIVRYLFRDDDTYGARAEAFFGHYFDVRITGGEIYVAGDVDGAALWNPPGGNRLGADGVEDHWKSAVVPVVEPDEAARYETFKKELDAITPPQPHWYLGLLGTDPARRRAGIASALLGPVLAAADRNDTPAFLETGVPANVAFYRRHGFEAAREADVPGGPHVWGLVRPSMPGRDHG